MDKKQLQLTYKELQNTLTARDFLQNAGLHKKDVLAVMDKGVWLEAMEKLMTGEVSCRNVLNLCSPAMENFEGSRPKDGWLPALYGHMIRKIYPVTIFLKQINMTRQRHFIWNVCGSF